MHVHFRHEKSQVSKVAVIKAMNISGPIYTQLEDNISPLFDYIQVETEYPDWSKTGATKNRSVSENILSSTLQNLYVKTSAETSS